MRFAVAILATASVACVHSQNAGPYPRNFNTATKLYLAPAIADAFYGPNDPMAQGWAVSKNGKVYVSPKMAKKIAESKR